VIIRLPFSSDPNQTVTIQLGSKTTQFSGNYQFWAYFNDRVGVWCIDISDANSGVIILQGIPLVLGCDLLAPYKLGIGMLIVFDETSSNKEATFDSLGDITNVYWISPDEDLVADSEVV
jgi:hypothetical protein